MTVADHAAAMLVAFALDVAIGWPEWLYLRIGHPVTWIGRVIHAGDRRLNHEGSGDLWRRANGAALAGGVIALAVLPSVVLLHLLPDRLPDHLFGLLPGEWARTLLVGILAWPLLAVRSLHQHVRAVSDPLVAGDLSGARRAVSMIVGRDPQRLDEAGVARAAAESLAENTSDGIVAPLFWGVLLGLPGIAAYKAINTMDSMIGHRTPRHEAFGWAAARIDDVVNLVPARLTGVLFAFAAHRPVQALRVMLRDARSHRSPNAGWPEAAFAGALGIRLSGPRSYADHVAEEPWLNGAAPDPRPADLARGLALYRRAMVILGGLTALLALTAPG